MVHGIHNISVVQVKKVKQLYRRENGVDMHIETKVMKMAQKSNKKNQGKTKKESLSPRFQP